MVISAGLAAAACARPEWMTVAITPLSPHPNDPALAGLVNG